MTDEEAKARDDIRADTATQTILDVLHRFEEMGEGTLSAYDLVGYVAEGMVKEGFCAACLSETLTAVFREIGADTTRHTEGTGTIH